jgi:hypothetical protein
MKPKAQSVFNQIAVGDAAAFENVTTLLGNAGLLASLVSETYELFIKLVVNSPDISKRFEASQTTALLHCLQALRYNMVMSTVTLFRGHVTDSTNYSRKSIEISAFLLEICSDPESAKRWLEMGKSSKARKKYTSRFQAHQIVVKHSAVLSTEVVDLYDNYCLFVHPSYASVHHNIEITNQREHQFHYFEHQSEAQQANLVMQYFILLNTHVLLMRALSLYFDKNQIGFPGKQWQQSIMKCATDIDERKKEWKPFLEKAIQNLKV